MTEDEHDAAADGQERRPGLDDAAVVEALRRVVRDVPAEDVRERHVAAISDAAATAGYRVPDTVPADRVSRWRRRVRRVLALTAVKVGLSGAAVALAAGGGLAATGNLPDPAQRVVADVAEQIGVELPRPADATASGERGPPTPRRVVPPPEDGVPPPGRGADRTVPPDRREGEQRPDDPASRRPTATERDKGRDARDGTPAGEQAPPEPPAATQAPADPSSGKGAPDDPGASDQVESDQSSGRPNNSDSGVVTPAEDGTTGPGASNGTDAPGGPEPQETGQDTSEKPNISPTTAGAAHDGHQREVVIP